MLKKILAGVSVSLIAATLAYAQNAPQAAPAAGAGRAANPNAPARPKTLPTEEEWAANPQTAEYVAKAKLLAGNDADLKFDVGIFCKASGGSGNQDRQTIGVPEGAVYAAFPGPSPAIHMPAQHMFDNFWWFGDSYVGAWLVTSNDGYILFDASNNEQEAQEVIIDEMKKNGLDPAKIKYVIYGHSHGDHTGGGTLFERLYHPRMIMGKADWDVYLRPSQGRDGAPPPAKMKRDIDAEDGMKITVGDTTATIYQMTGHTPGSIGMVVPVNWQNAKHNILIVTAATDIHNRESFVGGYEHIWDIGIKSRVEAVYQVHPNTNMNLLARTKYVNDNFATLSKGGKNPLLYGVDKTRRYIEIMRTCTEARMNVLGW